MADQHCFLGIDLGTSAVKIVLIDSDKKILSHQSVPYEVSSPEFGWREIDPETWFVSMSGGMDAIFSQYDPQTIDAIGITGQLHTVVMLSETGEPVRPAIMWDDMRTKDLIQQMRDIISENPDCAYITKNISTGSPSANLYWLRHFEPQNFARMKKFLIAPDYLVYCLTRVYGTDYTAASTSCLYDIHGMKWSPFMQNLIGLDSDVYPEVRGSGVIAGNLTAEIAKRFSMRENVNVLTGMGDNPATAVSAGCLVQGYPVISMGTSGVLIKPASKAEPQDTKGKMILFSPDGLNFSCLAQGALQSNGASFRWWVHSILGIDDYSQIDILLKDYVVRKSKLIFFPHLMGEKTLFSDPDIRGAFLGLSTLTTREDMLYAVIEGLCYGYRELAENMGLDLNRDSTVRIVGGGSHSRIQAQILANVLNVTVEQMNMFVSPMFGIALLAAYSGGFIESFDKIANNSNMVKEIFKPEAEAVKICNEKYTHYRKIYPALKSVYERTSP